MPLQTRRSTLSRALRHTDALGVSNSPMQVSSQRHWPSGCVALAAPLTSDERGGCHWKTRELIRRTQIS
jgi:hypothetical protein